MLARFYIRFRTRPGQSLCMEIKEEGSGVVVFRDLNYLNEECWKTELDMNAGNFSYRYLLKEEGASVRYDYCSRRYFEIPAGKDLIEVFDDWQDIQFGSEVFKSRAFSRVLNKKGGAARKIKKSPDHTHIFNIHAPLLAKGKAVCLIGSSSDLGKWDDRQFIKAEPSGPNSWTVHLKIKREEDSIEYKYAIYDIQSGRIECYEDGSNRSLSVFGSSRSLVILNQFAVFGNTAWRGAGVNVQLSSLRSSKSLGVGDFSDLKKLAAWSASVGIKMIQLLPINDTTASHSNKDSYPYAAISAFALHPMYLDVEKVAKEAGLKTSRELKRKLLAYDELPALAYEDVLRAKTELLRNIYDIAGDQFLNSPEFADFNNKHHYWLMPYAAFCYLRDKYGTADSSFWGEYGNYTDEKVRLLASEKSAAFAEIRFHYFLQFHLDRQLNDAVEFAHKKDIIIKGDLPIGVGRNSVDTWMNPDLFHMNMQAGAPPDAFTSKGQNWSFPTYNWEEMKKDGYAWWRQRLQQMSHYFDAIRIDHVLGFFRIWSIPAHAVEGILGYFVPAHPLSGDELKSAGLNGDISRYSDPFIDDEVIKSLFGENAAYIKEKAISGGKLMPALRTQRGILQWCAENKTDDSIRNKLLDLSAEVILIQDENRPGFYHFRIAMQDTFSFRHLSVHERDTLTNLYHEYFFRRQNELWYETAQSRLDAIQHGSDMMICAEDLGMVPEMVEGVLKAREMLALQVQRMPKQADRRFSDPADAPYLSVVTPSTHDMSTLREWWEEDKAMTTEFYHDQLKSGGTPPETCSASISGEIIKRHLDSPAMWAVFLLQDLLAVSESARREEFHEERINNPANPDHFWNYRLHLTIEDLQKHTELGNLLLDWIKNSGR